MDAGVFAINSTQGVICIITFFHGCLPPWPMINSEIALTMRTLLLSKCLIAVIFKNQTNSYVRCGVELMLQRLVQHDNDYLSPCQCKMMEKEPVLQSLGHCSPQQIVKIDHEDTAQKISFINTVLYGRKIAKKDVKPIRSINQRTLNVEM